MATWNIHDYLLPMWGTPVGELFDLEPLSETCKKLGRYSFFVTSAPLNVMGGIACTIPSLRRDPDCSSAKLSCCVLNFWMDKLASFVEEILSFDSNTS
jgi:hypothetical protein